MATYKEWALKTIPVLIRWAQAAWDVPHYYSDLAKAVGYGSNRMGGNVLGRVQDIIDELQEKKKKEIPTLNALVQNIDDGIPSHGFDYVIKDYNKLSKNSKKGEVQKLNEKAHQYEWDWVLKELKLEPAHIVDPHKFETLRMVQYGSGGEGEEHKAIKDFIINNPDSIGINKKKVKKIESERNLLSGDKLDVYFETKKIHYAIEVKPSTSPDADIRRGIFQCIKYKAVMDAERVVYGNYENKAILVVAGTLSPENKQIANDLNVKYIENFDKVSISKEKTN